MYNGKSIDTYRLINICEKTDCSMTLGIPVMRYGRAAHPCALNIPPSGPKMSIGHPPNALSCIVYDLLCPHFVPFLPKT